MGKPKIRFEGYSEDWEQRKLGDLIEDNIIIEQSDGNHGELYPRSDEFTDAGIPYIAASAISSSGDDIDFNLVKYLPLKRAEQFRKGVAQNGDILLAHNATVGPCLQLSMEYDFAILSTSLTLFRINENKMNSKFFLQMLRSDLFQNQLFKYMKQTTRSQVPILTQRKLEVCYPNNTQDQELIGIYLSNLDHLITLHQCKCDETKTLKKYMLQKMFPQNGEKAPEIRFDGFMEDWEQRKFSDIAARESSVSTSASDIPSVEYEDVVAEEGRLNKDIRLKEAVKSGITFDGSQVLYGKLRPYLHNWLNPDFKGIAVGDWWVLKPINMDKHFLYRLIQTQQFDNIANQSSGSKMPRADWNLISNSEFMVPFSKEEQSKIGRSFDSLDQLITLHQRKCNELKEIKKYMLQNMFV